MKYIKASTWNGKDLKGVWQFNWKIDGVRVLWNEDHKQAVSRDNKPFDGLTISMNTIALIKLKKYGDCEFFRKDWNTSVSIARNVKEAHGRTVFASELFPLKEADPRLVIDSFEDPTAKDIELYLRRALDMGYEGLILRQGNKWLRVKPKLTADVRVLDVIEGTGKHKGRMGALVTTMGKVGTGFTDELRATVWRNHQMDLAHMTRPFYRDIPCINSLIEIEFTELTKNGLPRFPRFKRVRTDKETESID